MRREPTAGACVTGESKQPEPSRREFLGLTLATALAAPLMAVPSAAAPVRDPGLADIDRLEQILRRHGSELGHLTSTR